jgi:hypothetical protein
MTRFLPLLLCCVLLAGCAGKIRSTYFKSNPVPYDGKELPDGFWKDLQTHDAATIPAGKAPPPERASDRNFWVLPLQLNLRSVTVSQDRKHVNVDQLVWNDLLSPVILTSLPLRLKYRGYSYKEGSNLPTGFREFTWSPFLVEDRMIGDVDKKLRIKGGGLPLLGTKIHASNEGNAEVNYADAFDLRALASLWTLGPAYAKIEMQQMIDDKPTTVTAYGAAPLLLAGAPGLMLWTDYKVRDGRGGYATAHGPALGSLGYFAAKNMDRAITEIVKDEVTGNETTKVIPPDPNVRRFLLGGLLWHSYVKRDRETQALDKSRHGPLWTMFGWGHKDGRFNVRLFFLRIG